MKNTVFLAGMLLCGFVGARGADQPQATNGAIGVAKINVSENIATNMQAYTVYPEMQNEVDSWFKGAKTNGLACALAFDRTSYTKGAPFCFVNVVNTTTNNVRSYLHLPFEAMSKIELYDSQGKPMPKTVAGKQFGFWTQEQIKDQLKRIDPTTMRRKGHLLIHGLAYAPIGNAFSIPQAFQVRQPGEYTFHLSVRLIKSEQDQSGQYLTTLLPEVVAKVQIRPEDIPQPDLPPNAQTNSPAK